MKCWCQFIAFVGACVTWTHLSVLQLGGVCELHKASILRKYCSFTQEVEFGHDSSKLE